VKTNIGLVKTDVDDMRVRERHVKDGAKKKVYGPTRSIAANTGTRQLLTGRSGRRLNFASFSTEYNVRGVTGAHDA